MRIFKNKFFIIAMILAAAGGGIYYSFGGKAEEHYITVGVKRGSLAQTVSETGTVKAGKEIALSLPAAGKISGIYAAIGDQVKKDQMLAQLDLSDLALKQKEAEANLRVAEANLAKILAGAAAAEVAVSQAGANQAKTAYESALNELAKIKDAVEENIAQTQKKLDDLYLTSGPSLTSYRQKVNNYKAVALTVTEAKLPVAANALDHINTILTDNDAKNFLGAGNSSLLKTTLDSYDEAGAALSAARTSLAGADVLDALRKTFEALKDCYSLLEASISGGNFSRAELDAYKTDISARQSDVSAGITSAQTAQHNLDDAINDLNNAVSSAKNDLATAQADGAKQIAAGQAKVDNSYQAWLVAEAQLNQLKAGAREQDVSLARAQVSQAQAALDLVKNQISNNILKAPFDGVIIKKNYETGEQFSPSRPVFSILGGSNFEIEVDISEANIAKLAVGNAAEITLDAFGADEKFFGRVDFIEPAETVIEGVIYYKVKINFDGRDKAVKSGMTANADITTARLDNILIAPARAVVEKNGGDKFVRLLVNGRTNETPVTVGLRGDDGLVEVLSGLKEGDEAVTFIQTGK